MFLTDGSIDLRRYIGGQVEFGESGYDRIGIIIDITWDERCLYVLCSAASDFEDELMSGLVLDAPMIKLENGVYPMHPTDCTYRYTSSMLKPISGVQFVIGLDGLAEFGAIPDHDCFDRLVFDDRHGYRGLGYTLTFRVSNDPENVTL